MNESQRTPFHAGQSAAVRAAIIGMGTWGQNLVSSVQGKSELIRFVAGATRTPARAEEFGRRHGIPLQASFEAVLADPSIDAVVLATPHSMHTRADRRRRARGQACLHRQAARPHGRAVAPPRSRPVPSTR